MGFFSKGSNDPAPMPDYSGMMAQQQEQQQMMMGMMMEMMSGMGANMAGMTENMASAQAEMMANAGQIPEIPAAPAAYRTPEIDWSSKQDQIAAKAKADYNIDKARRKGRQDTILTSPLLDDDDAVTTGSVLSGA